jgi:carboxyl-terminal processing protease
VAAVLIAASIARGQNVDPGTPEAVFMEAWLVINSAFYDANFGGADWNAVREELQPKAAATTTRAELSAVINDALSRLHASHTQHYTQDQREYYEILDIFWPGGVPERKGSLIKPGTPEYVGVGLATRVIDGHTFVMDVYDGGPADQAGIHAGDELIGVEGGSWGDVVPFREREGKDTRITIQRTPDPSSRRVLTVTPALIRPHELFVESIKASGRVIDRGDTHIAYIRVRSYSSRDYQDEIKDLLRGPLGQADALVLDIRGGWGGASPEYLDLFNPVAPALVLTARDGTEKVMDPTWRKPAVMLIDGGSRSGKEMVAYAFKKHHLGTLVGERTAGAFLGGTTRPLADGSVLYLAMYDVRVDGERLEGTGVEPDLVVKRNLPYCDGKDEQLDAAVDAAAARVRK